VHPHLCRRARQLRPALLMFVKVNATVASFLFRRPALRRAHARGREGAGEEDRRGGAGLRQGRGSREEGGRGGVLSRIYVFSAQCSERAIHTIDVTETSCFKRSLSPPPSSSVSGDRCPRPGFEAR
jgi:hypothetical protein